MASPRKNRGFSLVELMVAVVAGLLVATAAVAFMFSSMKSNKDFVGAARLTQELRNNMDFINREMRRAGYDEQSLRYVAMPAANTDVSPFAPIILVNAGADDSCVLYSYDRAGNDEGQIDDEGGERLGLRRVARTMPDGSVVGVLEYAESNVASTPAPPTCGANGPDYTTYPPTCNTSTSWCSLSDPRRVNITSFNVSSTPLNVAPSASGFGTKVRDLSFSIAGTLTGDPDTSQTLRSSVRVRAECLYTSANTTRCELAP